MDDCLDTLFLQEKLKLSSPLTKDGEQMIDILCVWQPIRKHDSGNAGQLFIIPGRNLGPMGVVFIQIPQLDRQNSGLDLIQPAVPAAIPEFIFSAGPIVRQRADNIGQLRVIRRHGATVPEGPKILARIETVAGSIAETARPSSIRGSATMRLRIVLDQQKVMPGT